MRVRVEAHSGYKANERPLRFWLEERCYQVLEVADRWYGPDYVYFRVRADDGCVYVLRLDERAGEWDLASVRAPF